MPGDTAVGLHQPDPVVHKGLRHGSRIAGTGGARMKLDSWTIDETKFLNSVEVKKLRRAARRAKEAALTLGNTVAVRDWFVVELALSTGLRVSEMAALRCGDILTGQNGHRHVFVRNGKCGKPRHVKVSSEFCDVCREFMAWKEQCGESTEPEEPVFRSTRTGEHMTTRALQKAFKRCLARAKLDNYGIHATRHTYGTHLYRASKFNLRLVQKQLGHSSSKVTEVYANLFLQDVEKSVERLYGA